jgi:signal transduction histidine kinase/CheY-like chemotaxis protein
LMIENHAVRNNISMKKPVSSLIEAFVPPSAYSNQITLNRTRNTIKAMLFISLIGWGLVSLYLVAKPSLHTLEIISFLGGGLAPILGPILIRFGHSLLDSIATANIVGLLFVTIAAYFSGGVTSPISLWFLVNTALLASFGDRPIVIVISCIIVLCLTFLFFIEELGFPPPPVLSDYLYQLLHFSCIVGAVILIAMGALISLKSNKRTRNNLARAAETADAANQAKSQFLSSMSHELRTPLNAILGFGQLLQFELQSPLSDKQISQKDQLDQVDHILDAGNHLLLLISEILELSHIESGTMSLNIEDVSIAIILKDCQSLMSVIASDNGIEILVVGDALEKINARVDYSRFKQVLINLIANAIKYNRQNGKVIISAEQITGSMLRLAISDTGYGIPNDNLHQLFKPFSRLGAETGTIEGTGIGLVVCKDLIEMMGGTIGVDSEEDKGSTFWVEVPIATPRDNISVAISESSPISEKVFPDIKGTLLYVEDTPTNIRLMESIVAQIEGLTMVAALTGKEGVELAKVTKPDIIILDVNLPDMSGIEVLEELRRHDETRAIPTLALSAAATKGDVDSGLDAGFRQYLTKPIQVSEVVEAISVAMT